MTGWQTLLAPAGAFVAPWTGGKELRHQSRIYALRGAFPREHGWYTFEAGGGRVAAWDGKEAAPPPDLEALPHCSGFLVGDQLLPDNASLNLDVSQLFQQAIAVHLVEAGLERFARVRCVLWEEEKWIYHREEFPLGPEEAVRQAYQDRKEGIAEVANVPPALHLAFLFEVERREQVEEQARKIAEERAREERLANAARLMGTGQGRRELAQVDIGAALKAALQVSGAELLDYRTGRVRNEVVVQYRFMQRRLECVVTVPGLRVVEAGVCLTSHRTGERGDSKFVLESLPGVVAEAVRTGQLVILRHVGDYDYDDDEYGEDD